MANNALAYDDWIQIGMDPERHCYFYDRKSQEPVIAGSMAIQIGGLIMLKYPVYANKSKFLY